MRYSQVIWVIEPLEGMGGTEGLEGATMVTSYGPPPGKTTAMLMPPPAGIVYSMSWTTAAVAGSVMVTRKFRPTGRPLAWMFTMLPLRLTTGGRAFIMGQISGEGTGDYSSGTTRARRTMHCPPETITLT